MDRRNFIKTIAAATTAPLALLATKPAAKFIPDKAFQDALTEVVREKLKDSTFIVSGSISSDGTYKAISFI